MQYNYAKQVNITELTKEIQASSIVTALDYMNATSSSVDIFFKATLSAGDKTTLDTVVTNHVYGPDVFEPVKVIIADKQTTSSGLPKTAVYEPEGKSSTVVTHDFTDKCSWYQGSVEIVGGTLTNTVGNSFKYSDKTHWIDLESGRLYDEDKVMRETSNKYRPKIYVDGVEQTSGFTIDYPAGTVTFDVLPLGVVTASFFYADKSWFILKPKAGKVLQIKAAEIQFSTNVVIHSPFVFEGWGVHPTYGLVPDVSTQIVYKNPKDFISAANEGQGLVPRWGGLTYDVHVFPFNYARPKAVKDSQGAEIRVYIKDHKPIVGEYATGTFYVTVEDEIV